jgi:hypothetical protein
MAIRSSGNDPNLIREQYKRLADAVDGFYAGEEFQALNIAVTLRLLVHETRKSHSLLSRVGRKYWDLTIRHRPLDRKVVFRVPITLRVSGDGTKSVIRSDFASPDYQLVSLRQWWKSDYQPIGPMRLSKQRIILNVANTSGGAHRMRVLLHQNTAIYASFVSRSNLSFVLRRNPICVGHGFRLPVRTKLI